MTIRYLSIPVGFIGLFIMLSSLYMEPINLIVLCIGGTIMCIGAALPLFDKELGLTNKPETKEKVKQ